MQKHLLYINLFTITSALALGACADEVENVATPDVPEVGEKTPIELSATTRSTEGASQTRAVIIDGKGKITAFEKDTRLHMLYVSENGSSTANPKPSMYAVTYGLAKGSGTAPIDLDPDQTKWTDAQKYSAISFDATRRCSQTYEDPARELESGLRTRTDNNAYEGSWRYWDDTYARDAQISVYGFCVANTVLPNGAPWNQKINGIASNGANQWYSDAIDYKIKAEHPSDGAKWTVGMYPNYEAQTYISTLYKDDICYSNNHTGDDALKFNPTSKKFDKGTLVFHRAMSLITIKLYYGQGFDKTNASHFKFDTGKNIAMKGFYKKGYLDIQTGEWSDKEKGSWTSICNTDPTPVITDGKPAYTLLAFVIPGDDLNAAVNADSNPADALTISIDGNDYKISKKNLYDALIANSSSWSASGLTQETVFDKNESNQYSCLKAGINYEFSFSIGKKGIDNVSAQIVDWETVVADTQTPSNARIELKLEERTGTEIKEETDKEDKFSLYRVADNYTGSNINDDYASYSWTTGYNTAGEIPTWSASHWKTTWYWESNKHFYHFRALCEDKGNDDPKAVVSPVVSNSEGDYYQLKAGETYKDICWGAPMLDDAKDETPSATLKWNYGPTINGFDGKDEIDFTKTENAGKHQIYKAIGPTEHQIKLILFHMMSDVTFKITTSGASDPDHVVFKDDDKVTKIELQKIYKTGNLYLGNGLVKGVFESGKTEKENYPFTAKPEPNNNEVIWSNYGAIPQDLTGVVLVITTADKNQYKVKMEDVLATSVSNNNIVNPYPQPQGSTKYQINRWYPGYKYTYTFKLTKKGITDLQATIVDWEVVEAGDDTVQIE